ncbi:MAG TPA: CHAD domain-containing protein [Nitrososphaeraceae archaeon]|nr:CHAD domain-containing protein [Nitrososphaeraceae archaeon]
MTITTFSSKQTIDKINTNFENVKNLLKLYLKNPNDKNIHDLRKSIRRLNAAYYALPKKYRKNRPIKNYVNLGQDLFKSNSQIRDYDIFLEKMDGHNGFNKKNNPLKDKIQQEKEFQLEIAKKIAQNLDRYDSPQIGTELDNANNKIQKRFQKVSKKLNDKIRKELGVVIKNERKKEKLHQLRKDCKKLRYHLELISDQDKGVEKTVEQLDNIQDILGEIHDSDTTVGYLEQQKQSQTIKNFIEHESSHRSNKYNEFINQYKHYTEPNVSLI